MTPTPRYLLFPSLRPTKGPALGNKFPNAEPLVDDFTFTHHTVDC